MDVYLDFPLLSALGMQVLEKTNFGIMRFSRSKSKLYPSNSDFYSFRVILFFWVFINTISSDCLLHTYNFLSFLYQIKISSLLITIMQYFMQSCNILCTHAIMQYFRSCFPLLNVELYIWCLALSILFISLFIWFPKETFLLYSFFFLLSSLTVSKLPRFTNLWLLTIHYQTQP